MSDALGRERDVWRRRVRAASAEASAEVDRFFDVGHVELRDGATDGEWDAIRSAPEHVRAALHGPNGSERLSPDVFLEQVRDRLGGLSGPHATLDDVVDFVRGLLARKSLFAAGAQIGAERYAVVRAALVLCSDELEAQRVEALFADDAALEVSLLHDPADAEREQVWPRLANSDPRLVARAAQSAAVVVALESQLALARADRDALVVECRRAGWGYDRIAAAVGVSKTRAKALCEGVTPIRRRATAWTAEDQF